MPLWLPLNAKKVTGAEANLINGKFLPSAVVTYRFLDAVEWAKNNGRNDGAGDNPPNQYGS